MPDKNRISMASIDDASKIMRFIDREWKQGHIFARSKMFFLHEYGDGNKLNFVISKNEAGEITGMLGFLKASSDDDSTVWTTMWKVSKNSGSPMLGVELLNFLRRQGYKGVMSLGINSETEIIYEYLGFHLGVLDHHFIPNLELKDFKIAIIPSRVLAKPINHIQQTDVVLKTVEPKDLKANFDFDKYRQRIPFKDLEYFIRRYFRHPIYEYKVYGCLKNQEITAIVVVRVCSYQNSTCMRIVDFHGEDELLSAVTPNLVAAMRLAGHEYIDLFSMGISEKILSEAGFLNVSCEQDDIVVPNYFEPFVQSNSSIRYFTDSQNLQNLRIFKGDGDQDRPSIMPERINIQ